MLSRYRHAFGVLFFLLVASCSGGGCGGCGGCAGVTPLAGGFPTDQAVENAASVRVTRPGLDFVEKELGPMAASMMDAKDGTFTVEIPEAPIDVPNAFLGFDVKGVICEGGADPKASPPKCVASVGLGDATFRIDALTPNSIVIRGVLPLKLDDAVVKISKPLSMTAHVGYGANATCSNGKPSVGVKQLPIKVIIPIVAETTAPRTGYSKVDVDAATIDLSDIDGNDVRICGTCSGLFQGVCEGILNWSVIKDNIVNAIKGNLDSQVKGLLRDQLCTKPNPALSPSCPNGAGPDAKGEFCVYDSAKTKCVPSLLGSDGHVDLGGLLASFSPSTAGALDFVLASFGPMQPFPHLAATAGDSDNGVTLGMAGGVLPQPPSKCVVQAPVTRPTGIPLPDELAPAAAEATGSPHVGIALSGRFLDYAFTSVYNSGLLCLGMSTEQVDMLKTGLLSLLIPSLKTLTFEQADAAAAIATRPQAPPIVKIGGGTDPNTDPLLTITLPKFALDFYVWSFDRFARVFTFTADLTVPVTLQTSKDGLVPTLGEIKVAGGEVSNGDVLLLDDPNIVAGAVAGIFKTVSSQVVGSGLAPIDLSSATASLGLGLEINEIKKLTKDSDDFIGIFATMSKAKATARSVTGATLAAKRVWREHMQATTYERAKLPELEVELSSSLEGAGQAVEYSWWIDSGTRSPWSTDARVIIKDDQLFMQGRHVLRVSSRLVGQPETEGPTPAEIPYVIDAVAPFVKVEADGASAKVTAWDLVSAGDALVARYRLDDGAFTEWGPAAALARVDVGAADTIEVEVRDEEGNVGTVRQGLRGRVDPTLAEAGAGCGCSTPGTSGGGGGLVAVLLGLAGLALIVARRRGFGADAGRRAVARAGIALGAIGAVAATSQGCSCGDESAIGTGCGSDCNQACQTGLENGQPGAYLSVAKAKDGTIWAAGYNDALLSEGDALLWGDLVVGKYDLGKEAVDWETVDGVPTRTDGTCPAYEPSGWRRGETDSGDNVGRWASMQLSAKDEPMVSYYDDTNRRLKLAVKDGPAWHVSVLKEQSGADIGKYSKMALVDGKPVIAYMHLEPGKDGRTRSKLVLARANTESPRGPEDFSFEDVAVDEDGPCRATSCSGGEVCVKDTGTCTKTASGCSPACGDAQACVSQDGKPTCVAKASAIETYPRGLGAYVSMATGQGGLGIVAYDGYHGNLLGFRKGAAGGWERVIIDGETGSRADKSAVDTGDVGIAASLAIDATGTWHVSYVSALDETLRYVTVTDGAPSQAQVVDDGTTVDGAAHADGKHIVGDDSAIRVSGDVVTIYYADSTSLGLRRAVGTRSGAAMKWDLRSVKSNGRWMAFPQFVPGEDKVAVWWRQSTRSTKTVEGNVTVLAP